MAVLTYGAVALQVLKTHHIGSEDVYDDTGLDYLWTRYTFDVTGLVNLAATAFRANDGDPVPVASPGVAPFLTIQNIRDTLSLPRQPLTYADETGNVMVQSPPAAPVGQNAFVPGGGLGVNLVPGVTMDCDCDGGPRPLRPVEVLSVHGAGHSVIVRFAVSTTVNDSIMWAAIGGLSTPGAAAPKPPVVLSNRWSTSERLDEAAFSTRTYTGRAVFRADILRDLTIHPPDGAQVRLAVPDDFRSYWGNFNIPPGFQRRQVFVEQEPDGFAVRYRVVDVQLPVTLTDQRAYKLEAVYSSGVSRPGEEHHARETANILFDLGYDVLRGTSMDPVNSEANAIAAGNRAVRRAIDLSMDVLPRSTDHFVITATGQPGSSRNALAGLCYKVWFNYFDNVDWFWSGTTMSLTVDMMGKWARLDVTLERGPVRTSILKGPSGIISLKATIPADDGIAGVTTVAPGRQPPFPSDDGTRGTALEWLVAQVLMQPYTEAPQPAGHSVAGQGLLPP